MRMEKRVFFNGFKCKYFDSWVSCIYGRCADNFFNEKDAFCCSFIGVVCL